MSHSPRRRRSRIRYGGAHPQPAWNLPLPNQNQEEQSQRVQQDGLGNRKDERYDRSRNERHHRPVLRDDRVQTDGACDTIRAVERTASANPNGGEDSSQAALSDDIKDELGGEDEIRGKQHETNDYLRRDRRRFRKSSEQVLHHDPPIASFVRSQAQRRSSYGRAFFSPSNLRNGETAMTRHGTREFPLLPIPTQSSAPSLSQAASDFANIRSGDFQLCLKFLQEHKNLLREDYHFYLQEAWKALWDEEKIYAHQCLSRWFLLDECRQIWPSDIRKHINQRTFSGSKFLDKVDEMYNTLKTLRQDVLGEMAQAADGAPRNASNITSGWSIKEVRRFFQGVDRAKVLSNVGYVYRLVTDMRSELKGGK